MLIKGGEPLSESVFDCVPKKERNYYPQMFKKVCKYIEEEIKVIRHKNGDLEISSDDSNESDKE